MNIDSWLKKATSKSVTITLFNIVWWCIFGLIAGALARYFVHGRNPMGCFGTLVLGLLGSNIGGLFGSLIFRERASGVEPGGIVLSLAGGLLVIVLYQKLARPPRLPDQR